MPLSREFFGMEECYFHSSCYLLNYITEKMDYIWDTLEDLVYKDLELEEKLSDKNEYFDEFNLWLRDEYGVNLFNLENIIKLKSKNIQDKQEINFQKLLVDYIEFGLIKKKIIQLYGSCIIKIISKKKNRSYYYLENIIRYFKSLDIYKTQYQSNYFLDYFILNSRYKSIDFFKLSIWSHDIKVLQLLVYNLSNKENIFKFTYKKGNLLHYLIDSFVVKEDDYLLKCINTLLSDKILSREFILRKIVEKNTNNFSPLDLVINSKNRIIIDFFDNFFLSMGAIKELKYLRNSL